MANIRTLTTDNYQYGLNTAIEAESIRRGAASSVLNWVDMGDHIELRRGQKFMGTDSVQSGLGRASGLKKVTDSLGVEKLFYTHGQKLKYYDTATEEFVESGSDIIGSAAETAEENIFMSEYVGTAGNQMWINSPNCSGYYKIMVANPGNPVNQYDSTKNFKGYIKIDTNRTLLWGRTNDKTGVYGSRIDTQPYTTVTNENIGTGDGVTTTFNATLAFKGGGARRTCFGVTVTSGSVTLTDNFAGTLSSATDASTGTINYATGEVSVTFATAPGAAVAVTATYQWEDAALLGIADFTKSATRLAGEGFVFRQDEGGGQMQNIGTYATIYFCFHVKKTWALTIGSDDTNATNLPYREKVGIPNNLARVETGDGIYYIDDQNPDDVSVRLLAYSSGLAQEIIPRSISEALNLKSLRFDQCAAIEWGDYVLFACRRSSSERNDRVLVYNKRWKSWTLLDYAVSMFEIYNGALVAGDSLSDNVLELFSGFDDLEALIDNQWTGRLDDLDTEGLKKTKKFYIRGLIAPSQVMEIDLAFDNGSFIKIGEVRGDGDYVDRSAAVSIGGSVIGKNVIGGGSEGDLIDVYQYERLISLRGLVDRFERVQIRYRAVEIGYVSVSNQKYWDIRRAPTKVPKKYRV